jgi:hypothetical protein
VSIQSLDQSKCLYMKKLRLFRIPATQSHNRIGPRWLRSFEELLR